MTFPSWLKDRERPERVGREDVIMELPQVSSEEWFEAATQYQLQAGQIAFAIGPSVTPSDDLLNRAEQELQSNSVSQGESLMWSAVESLRGIDSPDCLQGWVKAAMVAASSNNNELRHEIAKEGTARLLDCGLDGVAAAFRNYPEIQRQFGPETARALGSGMLNAVNSWCLHKAMEPSAVHE